MAEDVLEHNHRVIDQARENDRQPRQDHAVDRAAAEIERNDGSKGGERDGEEHGGRAPEAAQKQEHHQSSQQKSRSAFVDQRTYRLLDEFRLIECNACDELLGYTDQALQG